MLHQRIQELTGNSYNGNNNNANSPAPMARRRTKLGFTSEKKIADDEFMAAAIGDTEWLRQSLRNNRGAINFDKNGLAPIHLAAIHGRLDCLRLLVDKLKLDVNLASTTGWRPVHLAISNQTGKRSYSCLSYLLAKGADPSIANEDGLTPMHQAASEGHVQCMKALIEAGACIDGEDCRGHKPLDLAKLWGHKKCARILAAEMWHRDKDFIAKEMRQLQKVKMQQVLREIEEDEEHRADQQFYGDIAFNQWLDAKNLPKKTVGPPSLQNQADSAAEQSGRTSVKGKGKGKADSGAKREPLARTNSIQRPAALKQIEEEEGRETADGSVTPGMKDKEDKEEKTRTRAPEVKFIEPVKEGPPAEPQEEKEKKPTFVNPDVWNKSTKISPPEYVTILPDHYPRDEYTMLPKHPAVRQRPPNVGQDTGAPSSTGNSSARDPSKNGTPLRMPKLPAEIIEKALNRDSAKKERRVVYKCKNIMDVQKRQHFNPDIDPVPRAEVGLHLTNQLDSRIFQTALQPERIPVTPSTVISGLSSRSSGSSRSSVQPVKIDVASVMSLVDKNNRTPNYG